MGRTMSDQRRPLVKNAADPRQVAHAERKERRREERVRVAIRNVLAMPAGRLLLWELLGRAGVYQSVFDASGSRTFYNAGRQDFGHELLALLVDADQEGYLEMEREARAFARNEQVEAAAAQTPAANEGGQ